MSDESGASPEHTYLVLVDLKAGGTDVIEVATEDKVVAEIAAGQIERASSVMRIDTWIGSTTDVSKQVAKRVLGEHLDGYGKPQRWVMGFLETQLGCEAVAAATREHAR